jgi:hypothetical protein
VPTLDIDVKIPEDAFKRFQDRVAVFPEQLAAELVTWQVQDMHRQYPNIDRPDQFTAETHVWARSRLTAEWHRQHRKPRSSRYLGRARRSQLQARVRQYVRGQQRSTRPILRPVLLEKLEDRVQMLIHELTWAK